MPTIPLQFDDQGLIPVVVQDDLTGEVRMVAFATLEAVRATLATGRATFWSRSRGELWEKGRTSGNTIQVNRVLVDCDADTLIYSSEPRGPTCHTGAETCFFQVLERTSTPTAEGAKPTDDALLRQKTEQPQTLLATVEAILESRKKSTSKASYTKSLYDGGAEAIGAKLREEAGELAEALANESDERVVSEAADVLYHTLVALRWRALPLRDVLAALAKRLGTSGHEEKARRGA
jgi:phosphoribosyl-AMP cyclohydrolase / phosphoribosyl-ATP pyrophosphohydrolase